MWQSTWAIGEDETVILSKVTLRAFRDACCVHAREEPLMCATICSQSLEPASPLPCSSQYNSGEAGRWAGERTQDALKKHTKKTWALGMGRREVYIIRDFCFLSPFKGKKGGESYCACSDLPPLSIGSGPALMHNSCNQKFATVQNCVPHILCLQIGFP